VSASALHLPLGQTAEDLVAAHWEILGAQPNGAVAQLVIEGMGALRGLRPYPIHEVWGCFEKLRGMVSAPSPHPVYTRGPHGVLVMPDFQEGIEILSMAR
jgi:hypothetical protein